MNFITRKPLWVNILVGILLAVALFFIVVLSLRWLTHHGSYKTVPEVVGKNLNEASTYLEGLGFEVVVQDSVYQDSIPKLAIVRQVPEADAVVKVNRTIYVTVNRSVPPVVEMPALVGYSLRNAEMVLSNLGLRMGEKVYRPDFAKDNVLEQQYDGKVIPPGTKLRMGTPITLVLGTGVGQNNFLVPKLVGFTYDQARTILDANGLIAVPYLQDPDIRDTASAYVVRQDPSRLDDFGVPQKIRSGQMITLFLQKEKPAPEEPDDSGGDNSSDYNQF